MPNPFTVNDVGGGVDGLEGAFLGLERGAGLAARGSGKALGRVFAIGERIVRARASRPTRAPQTLDLGAFP